MVQARMTQEIARGQTGRTSAMWIALPHLSYPLLRRVRYPPSEQPSIVPRHTPQIIQTTFLFSSSLNSFCFSLKM
jgi:hypothetical protein